MKPTGKKCSSGLVRTLVSLGRERADIDCLQCGKMVQMKIRMTSALLNNFQ